MSAAKLAERLRDYIPKGDGYNSGFANDLSEAADLLAELDSLKLQLQHCQANHKNLVDKNALLRQRSDLPVDRLPAYERLKELRLENAELKARFDDGIRVYAECDKTWQAVKAWHSNKPNATLILDDRVPDKPAVPYIDMNYWCESCGSKSGECHPDTGACFHCGADDWEPYDLNLVI